MRDLGIGRRRPDGWLPAQAFALQHRSHARDTGESSQGDGFKTSVDLEVEWEVRVPGAEPYRFAETRKAPTWVDRSAWGSGKRWYSVKPKRTYGLLPSVGIPCLVDPDDSHALWIDWDAGYELHEAAWKDYSAAAPERRTSQREVRRREDEAVIARADAAPQNPDHGVLRDVARLYALGVTTSATVVSAEDTNRQVNGVPVWRFRLTLGDSRTAEFEQAVAKRAMKHYQAGSAITVYTDPEEPEAFALG